jgi:TolB-like protein/Tfp pilus assembly protein PilF
MTSADRPCNSTHVKVISRDDDGLRGTNRPGLQKGIEICGWRAYKERGASMADTTHNDKTVPGDSSSDPKSKDIPQIPDHELFRCVGSGAFGEVWLARNVLGHYRAVKIVHRNTFRDERTFEREFSGLKRFEPISRDHEGFVDILHVGRNDAAGFFHYVMELADDEEDREDFAPRTYAPKTLSTELARHHKLSFQQCLHLGLSLTDALAHLHREGLVHRDIKPQNIIFVKSEPKLADIGLVAEAGQRTFVGTEGFIPPEGPGNVPADLYSLGKVLYQSCTGEDRLEFPKLPKETDAAVPPDKLRRLHEIILKACESDVRKRYQTAEQLHADLTQLHGGALPGSRSQKVKRPAAILATSLAAVVALVAVVWVGIHKQAPSPISVGNSASVRSLAVLPLANYSGDTNQDYFADGMTETLIADLTQIRALDVRSRTSVGQYKGTQKPIPQIAKELHVDAIVEGSVMRVGNQVRITAQLIDAATDHHLWATNYDRDITDVLRLQAEVAQDIASAVQVTLTPQEKAKLAVARIVNPAAFDAYLKGRQYWYQFTPEGLQKAKEASLEAIQIDPEYAPAYAMLADCYVVLANMGLLPPAIAYGKAKEALAKALTLDESSDALRAQAAVDLFFDWDWPATKQHLDRAFELKPNDGETHSLYSDYAAAMGQFDAALPHARRSAELEPMVPMASFEVPWVLYLQRRYGESIRNFQSTLDLFPYLEPAKSALGAAYERNGQHAESIALFQKELKSGRNPLFLRGLGSALAGAGQTNEALKIVGELKQQYDRTSQTQEGYASPLDVAAIYAALDDKPAALEWLQRGFDGRAFGMYNLKVDPAWDNLRSEPGFQDLLRKMNLDGAPH